jgi:hypothetical protein
VWWLVFCTQEQYERDEHDDGPRPEHSAEGQLADVKANEGDEPDLGSPPSTQD